MKQILSENNVLIVSDVETIVISHPSTIFTDDNVMVNKFINQLIITGLNTEQIDSVITQIAELNAVVDILNLQDQPRSTQSDYAVEKLVNEGATIITVEL